MLMNESGQHTKALMQWTILET